MYIYIYKPNTHHTGFAFPLPSFAFALPAAVNAAATAASAPWGLIDLLAERPALLFEHLQVAVKEEGKGGTGARDHTGGDLSSLIG
jgi:hypothetical protein